MTKRIRVKKIRPGFAKGYNSKSKDKGRFVITDAQLRRMEKADVESRV